MDSNLIPATESGIDDSQLETKRVTDPPSLSREQRKSQVLSVASWEAFKWGAGSLAAVGAVTAFATYRSKKFDRATSISAKVAIPVMTGLWFWTWR
jgi:hypothetical protein